MHYKKIFYMAGIALAFMSCKNGNDASDAFGNFESTEVLVSSDVSGRLIQCSVDEGDKVNAQQQIGAVDSIQLVLQKQQLLASKESAKARISQASASIQAQQVQLKVAGQDLERIKNMLAGGAATQKQMDEIQGRYDVLSSQLSSMQAQKQAVIAEAGALYAQIARISDQINRCNVFSPIEGTVLQKYTEQGEMVQAGKPILKVADVTILYLRAYVTGAQLADIKIGQKVKVFTDKDEKNNQETDGVITWISSKAEFTPKIIQTKEERVDLVYAIKVKVINDGRFHIGMPGEVKF